MSDLRSELSAWDARGYFALENIPNKQLWKENRLAELIIQTKGTSSTMAQIVTPPDEPEGLFTPWEVKELAASLGLNVRLSWARQANTSSFDAVFFRGHLPINTVVRFKSMPLAELSTLCNTQPHSAIDKLEGVVREHLGTRLPSFMRPRIIVTMEKLPVTANGKVDRRQLSSAESIQLVAAKYSRTSRHHELPRTEH